MKVALLAPVPVQHLESADRIIEPDGSVLFGSDKYEFFEATEVPSETPVYFYASHTGAVADPSVTWVAKYVRYWRDEDVPRDMWKRRPPSTDDDSPWVGCYEVRFLRRLDPKEVFAIKDLAKVGGGALSPAFIPESPILVRA